MKGVNYMNKSKKETALSVIAEEYIWIIRYWSSEIDRRRKKLDELCDLSSPQLVIEEAEKSILEAEGKCAKYTKLLQDTIADMETYGM